MKLLRHAGAEESITVYFFSVAYGKGEKYELIVLDGTDYAVIAYAVAPLAAAVCCEGFAEAAGIQAIGNVTVHP